MSSVTGPPPRKKPANDELALFLHDVALDEKFSERLMKVRRGTPAARKQAVRELAETTQCVPLIEAILPMLNEADINESERFRLVKLLCRLLQRQPALGSASPVCSVAPQLLDCVKTLLNTKDAEIQKQEALPLLLSTARIIGLKAFLTTLRPTFDADDDNTRQSNATCIAAAAQTFGLSITLPLVKVLVNSTKPFECLLGLLVVQRLPTYLGGATLPVLHELVNCCLEGLKESSLSSNANAALTALANEVSPFGIEAFEPAMDSLWTGARRRRGRPKVSFMRTLSSLAPLTDPSAVSELATPLLKMAVELFDYDMHETQNSEGEIPRLALGVAKKCINYVDESELKAFLPIFFASFWTEKAASNHRTASLAVWTAVELPVSRSELINSLVESNALVSDSVELQRMALELLARLDAAPLLLSHRNEERLVDGLIASLPDTIPMDEQEEKGLVDLDKNSDSDAEGAKGTNNNERRVSSSSISALSVRAVKNVVESLPEDRVKEYSRLWVTTLLGRGSDPSPLIRQNSAKILANIAPTLPRRELVLIFRKLYEELGEEYPEVLREIITALHDILASMHEEDVANLDPSLSQVLPRLTPILRNRNERVQESCIKLIRAILDAAGEDISAQEWMHICFELLELQKSQRQSVRFEATATFAAISAVVGPADVVATLLNHLRSPDRQFRVTTAAAIASVAEQTGPFTVLPILMNEYTRGEIVIQHGVLKTLSFMFQFIGKGKGLPYIPSASTLLDDALVDRNQVHRQMAASAVHFMAQGSIGCGQEAIFIHFLNELMPSIFETSPQVIDRVMEAINSIRQVIGTPAFLNYIWAGLFHPARKVRNVYWQLWNLLYCDDADAIVPEYPVYISDPNAPESGVDIRDVWI